MKSIVFYGKYDNQILSEAMALGRIYWSDYNSLREMLRKISAVDTVFVNAGHVDIEMLEDCPQLREMICSEEIWSGLEASAVSALGIIALQMPDAASCSDEWMTLFEKLRELYLGYKILPVLNPEAYHHPDWVRMKLKQKTPKEGMKL